MIKNNEIELIDEDFFISLPDLEVIALDNNKLSTFPKSLENLKKIKKLTYKNNNFKDVPEWVEALGTAVASVLKMGIFIY
jgi:Leucine-rich repeat (LRR) protein